MDFYGFFLYPISMDRWREIQKQNFTHWEKLVAFLQLDPSHLPKIWEKSRFPLNLPLRLAAKIEKNNWDDPLLKQFLPTREETVTTEGFSDDPVSDASFRIQGKLLKKYQGRALLLTSSACAMHCRFCFRQNFPYERELSGFEQEIAALSKDRTIREVILSGGDPLSLSNEALSSLVKRLALIPHLKRLRFHTRFPLGIPERIDHAFLTLLETTPLQTFFVIHCNHAKELDREIFAALKKIQRLGIVVLTHTVLLKGVNDSVETLKELAETLVDNGILPYYLNQLDRVEGAAHFEVEETRGRELVQQLQEQLSGYAQFRYIREIPNQPSKTHLLS